VVVALACALAGASCRPSSEIRPPFIEESRAPGGALEGTILFTSNGEANFGIFALDPSARPDDRRSFAVTDPGIRTRSPAYAPGGGRLAYAVVRSGSGGIAVVERPGAPPRMVVDGEGLFDYPSWSPDGSQIAYAFSPGFLDSWNLYVVDVAGGATRQLTSTDRQDWYPAWSPDGARIAFTSDRDGDNAIWWVGPDGGAPEKVVDSLSADEGPVWSPDGRRLVFTSKRELDRWQLYEVDPLTRVERQVIRTDTVDRYPRFSPDGRYLVVSSGYVAIYRADGGTFPDGSDRWKLSGRLSLGAAAWSPRPNDFPTPA
jgi:Tol biopolymer transport system component